MDSAARLPAATASITDLGPLTASPPAKTPGQRGLERHGIRLEVPARAAPTCLSELLIRWSAR